MTLCTANWLGNLAIIIVALEFVGLAIATLLYKFRPRRLDYDRYEQDSVNLTEGK